jgi:epsilon-lactone hydrolase
LPFAQCRDLRLDAQLRNRRLAFGRPLGAAATKSRVPKCKDQLVPMQFANVPAADGSLILERSVIPVPTTVSPQARTMMAMPFGVAGLPRPTSTAEWKFYIASLEVVMKRLEAQALVKYPMKVERRMLAGVRIISLEPPDIPPANMGKMLINMHGGAFVLGADNSLEALSIAAAARMRVTVVDYRMPPDHPFPAAIEDGVAVFSALLELYRPSDIGIFGASAGGNLTCAVVLRLRDLERPLPAAIAVSTPGADLSRLGDSWHTNDGLDRILTGSPVATQIYAGGRQLDDPLLSPVYARYDKAFPPALLLTGTRDMLLSSTVRLHRAMRRGGASADLHVFEGMCHGLPTAFDLPEHDEYRELIAQHFDHRLARSLGSRVAIAD